MEYNVLKIRDLAVEERPREKCLEQGVGGLSNTELLAILIGTGTTRISALDLARQLLSQSGNDLHRLSKATLPELQRMHGIGQAKAVRVMAAFELARRKKASPPGTRPAVRCSQDAFRQFEGCLADLTHEEFWILLLNRSNHVTDRIRISQGGVSGTVTDVRIILNAAVEKLASGIILAHNHPSGNLSPSEADIRITKKISEACRMLDLTLLDHLILSDQGYLSMADDNLMP